MRDKTLFYHSGTGNVPTDHLQTILRLLAHARIPALFDEFTSITVVELGREYKVRVEQLRQLFATYCCGVCSSWGGLQILLEDTTDLVALSAVLFGSNEAKIWDRGVAAFSGMQARGARMCQLALPPLSLIVSMLRVREPSLEVVAWHSFISMLVVCCTQHHH